MKKINIEDGAIVLYGASQNTPYKLVKKVFKNNEDKKLIIELKKIVRKYYPNCTDKDIINLCNELKKEGCTFAYIANIIIHTFENREDEFEHYFGYKLYKKDKSFDYDRIMVDIFACLSSMIQLDVFKYQTYSFTSFQEAAEKLLNEKLDNDNAIIRLMDAGIISNGRDNNKLLFINKNCSHQRLIGTYTEIASQLFGINKLISKEELINLLDKSEFDYKISYDNAHSKLSGLLKSSNSMIWMNEFFKANNINLSFKEYSLVAKDYKYKDLKKCILNLINNEYYIGISTYPNSNIYMTDGKIWINPASKKVGHQMIFSGYDKSGNIIVSSWGELYMIPKEYYQQLEFNIAKLEEKKYEIEKTC